MTEATGGYTQNTYDLTLRFKGGLHHSLPLFGVTKRELQLLAYLHGVESVVELRAAGMKRVVSHVDDETTPSTVHYVEDEMGEFRRLARKYDTIVNSGRGQKAVEDCFKVQITDFDSIIREVNALDEMDRKAAEAEAATALKAGGEEHERRQEALAKAAAPVGSRVFAPS